MPTRVAEWHGVRGGKRDVGVKTTDHGEAGASELIIATSERGIISTSDLQHGITILPLYYSTFQTHIGLNPEDANKLCTNDHCGFPHGYVTAGCISYKGVNE